MVGVRGCLVIQDEEGDHGLGSLEKTRVVQRVNQVWYRQRVGEPRGGQVERKGGSEDQIAGMKVVEELRMVAQRGSEQLELGGEPGRMLVLREMRDGFLLLGLEVRQERRKLHLEKMDDFCQLQPGEGREHWQVLPWMRCGCGDGPSVLRWS